jgi:hypothetical protein
MLALCMLAAAAISCKPGGGTDAGTGAQVEKLLGVARGEIGVTAPPEDANAVTYNTWYYGRDVSGSGYAWCGVFVLWCFDSADMLDLTWESLNSAKRAFAEGVRNWKALALSTDRWITSDYEPGDVVMLDFDENPSTIEHVGIVESVSADGKTLTTIEGNTSDGDDVSQSDGGCVARKSRDASLVVGAYRPPYETDDDEAG